MWIISANKPSNSLDDSLGPILDDSQIGPQKWIQDIAPGFRWGILQCRDGVTSIEVAIGEEYDSPRINHSISYDTVYYEFPTQLLFFERLETV